MDGDIRLTFITGLQELVIEEPLEHVAGYIPGNSHKAWYINLIICAMLLNSDAFLCT